MSKLELINWWSENWMTILIISIISKPKGHSCSSCSYSIVRIGPRVVWRKQTIWWHQCWHNKMNNQLVDWQYKNWQLYLEFINCLTNWSWNKFPISILKSEDCLLFGVKQSQDILSIMSYIYIWHFIDKVDCCLIKNDTWWHNYSFITNWTKIKIQHVQHFFRTLKLHRHKSLT